MRRDIGEMRELEAEQWPKLDELKQKRERLAQLVGELEREAEPSREGGLQVAPATSAEMPAPISSPRINP